MSGLLPIVLTYLVGMQLQIYVITVENEDRRVQVCVGYFQAWCILHLLKSATTQHFYNTCSCQYKLILLVCLTYQEVRNNWAYLIVIVFNKIHVHYFFGITHFLKIIHWWPDFLYPWKKTSRNAWLFLKKLSTLDKVFIPKNVARESWPW